jgi:UDP:flavonoid glycosyltransferase YjiC (YdhE family)
MKRVLLLPIGSSGDVNPFLWIGRHLHELGHEVTVIANPYFARHVIAAGLRHVPIGSEEEYHALTEDPAIWHPTAGTPLVLRYAGDVTKRYFDLIQSEAGNDRPLVLAPATGFGARLAREKLGLPLVSVNLQPSIYRSVHDTACFGRGFEFFGRLPRWAKHAFFSLVDWRINRELRPGISRACLEQGVKMPRNPFRDWWQSPDGVLCLWPEWFAAPQPDWPASARCIGFPLEDLASHHARNPDLEAFLAAGEPPVLFTPGTAMAHGREFFDAAFGACAAVGRRAIFVTRYPDQLPPGLPTAARHFDYLPFSDVLPRCAAIVHHGGIGTTSQAFAAGIPQLIMPLAHDQPDNAARVGGLGVGSFLWPRDFVEAKIADALRILLSDSAVRERCASVARRLKAENPSAALLDALAPHLA